MKWCFSFSLHHRGSRFRTKVLTPSRRHSTRKSRAISAWCRSCILLTKLLPFWETVTRYLARTLRSGCCYSVLFSQWRRRLIPMYLPPQWVSVCSWGRPLTESLPGWAQICRREHGHWLGASAVWVPQAFVLRDCMFTVRTQECLSWGKSLSSNSSLSMICLFLWLMLISNFKHVWRWNLRLYLNNLWYESSLQVEITYQ